MYDHIVKNEKFLIRRILSFCGTDFLLNSVINSYLFFYLFLSFEKSRVRILVYTLFIVFLF